MNCFSPKISRILIGVMTTAVLLTLGSTAFLTPAKARTYGPYEYTASSGKATITGYTGSGGDVVIPETLGYCTVVGIGTLAFRECTTMTSVTIPDSVTKIDTSAFARCSNLTTVTIPDSVLSLGSDAFHNCTSLSSVTIGNGVTQIPAGVFDGCSSLTSVTLGNSVTEIGNEAFRNCAKLTAMDIPEGVTRIGDEAFSGCTKLTSVDFPDSVTTIGEKAFFNCSKLNSITLSDGLTTIGSSAFCQCSNLTAVTIGSNVTSVGSSAFKDCTKLTTVNIMDGAVGISGSAFEGCTSLQYNYYDCGKYLGNESNPYTVFLDTTSETITHCEIHPQTKVLGGISFRNCASLTSVVIPDGVTAIGNQAFYGCTALTSVDMPEKLAKIESYAFDNCRNLTSIAIPDSVTEIGIYAFYQCLSLRSVTIPDGVTEIGAWTFSGCSSLCTLRIGSGVKSIGNGAFAYCKKLVSVIIPDGVESMGNNTFVDCGGMTTLTIPVSLKSVGYDSFLNCSSLNDVYYAGNETQWKKITIGNDNEALTGANIHYWHVHDFTLIPPVERPATCTGDGYTDYTCIFGERYRVILPATGHCAGENQTVIPPTCLEEGYTQSNCANCAVPIKTDYVPALDHDFSGKETVVEPTCQAGGHTIVQCIRCQEQTTKDPTPFLGHDFSGRATVIEPTCQMEGYTEIQCIRCEETKKTQITGTVPHSMTVLPAVAPTCAEFGWTIGTECRWCGLVGIVRNPVAKLEHTMQNGICVVCGESEEYVIIFLDEDGETITQSIYRYGDTVEVPADPIKAADNTYTYTFSGWDQEVLDCTGDATYTATYKATYIDYTVTFLDEDGTEIAKATYHYGDKVEIPADPAKTADNTYTYTFSGWDKEVVDCVGDATYTATYKAAYIDYTVTFLDEDGTEIAKATYHYGDKVTAPAEPSKAADNTYTYTFVGWDQEVADCTGDATYTATYKASYIEYTVKFVYEDGVLISEKAYHYGDPVEVPDDPEKAPTAEGVYTFIGWDKEITAVTGDVTYTAQFTFAQTLPDFTGDGQVTDADAIYLLRNTLFPESYPLSGNGDINCDGQITDADAIYLLRHTLFPENYPLYPKKED